MKIVAYYSFNDGWNVVTRQFAEQYAEIVGIIDSVDASLCKTKKSKEKSMSGRLLFSPVCLNNCFKREFHVAGWNNHKEPCQYVYGVRLDSYTASSVKTNSPPFRDMDFVKPGIKLGIEVQFGKYAFMVYNVCAKMTIFHNFGLIDAGIEIVPAKHLADEMSTGVSYFEQIAWDLEKRGVSNIDIPVLILGIDL